MLAEKYRKKKHISELTFRRQEELIKANVQQLRQNEGREAEGLKQMNTYIPETTLKETDQTSLLPTKNTYFLGFYVSE